MSAIFTKLTTVSMLAGVCLFTGCYGTYSDLVDPCYPERYNCKSREAVQAACGFQELNGLALEHTVYNYHFKDGTDELLEMGQAHLSRLANRKPAPEQVIYVQSASDVKYNSAKPEEFKKTYEELNQKRLAVVQKYLQMTRGDVAFSIELSSPSRSTYISGREATTAMDDIRGTARGQFIIPGFSGGGNAGGNARANTGTGASGQ